MKTVTMALDQWPVVLYALEQLAKTKKSEGRDLAEAVALETRIKIIQQLEA